jgi:hypothetical protein
LREARVVANQTVDQGRKKIEGEVNAIRFNLGKQSEIIARDIATRVLGREVS